MSSFTDARLVRTGRTNAAGRPIYRVEGAEGDGFRFYVGAPGSGLEVHVREGFLSDRASWLTGRQRRALALIGLGPLIRWVDDCLEKASLVHDRMREDPQFSLIDADGHFWIAAAADLPSWRGPGWARRALRDAAFLAVRTNKSRAAVNAG